MAASARGGVAVVHQVARVRHHHVGGVAAAGVPAEQPRLRGRLQQFSSPRAQAGAVAAADPGKDRPMVADLDALDVRPDRDHLAGDLVAQGVGQLQVGQRQLGAAAQVEGAVVDVHVGVADAAVLDAHQHLRALRRRGRRLRDSRGLPNSVMTWLFTAGGSLREALKVAAGRFQIGPYVTQGWGARHGRSCQSCDRGPRPLAPGLCEPECRRRSCRVGSGRRCRPRGGRD